MDPNDLKGSASVGETRGIITAATAAPLRLGFFPNAIWTTIGFSVCEAAPEKKVEGIGVGTQSNRGQPRTFVLHLHCLRLLLSSNINRSCPAQAHRQRKEIPGRNITVQIPLVLHALGKLLSTNEELSVT